MGCYYSKKVKRSPGYEEPTVLASETPVLDLFDVKFNGVIESRNLLGHWASFIPTLLWRRKVHLKEMVLTLLIEFDLALSEDVVETIVDKTFTDADSKGNGRTNMHQMAARLFSSQTIKGGGIW
ncbi:hypothetical protein IFM89_026420 [Coptis chinensis]|uniref:Calcineurin B-like protein n=1 Tax=Coptis chinensis TaxID=261450 RepID=A0A835LNL9_9MAGN|nr:hypothetical protein IFM89_026420 [Coptis chinensis]